MTNLDNILKSRHITLLTKVHLVKAMIFPTVMYGYESWTIKKAEHWSTDALELWCWRRLLRVPWTPRRSNQSILKEINSEYSLGGWRANSLKPKAGKVWRQAEKGMTEHEMVGWHHWLNEHDFEQTLGDYEVQESLLCFSPGHNWARHNIATEQQQQ